VGSSTFFPARSYCTWPADITQLADTLGIGSFAVVGYSSGGPNAMACASGLPERVTAVGLASSDAPYLQMGDGWVKRMYGFETLESVDRAAERTAKSAASMEEGYQGMKNAERREVALADLEAATQQGFSGAAMDSFLEANHWGFSICDIKQPVLLFHGDGDDDVPLAAANFNIAELEKGTTVVAKIIEGENHTLIRRHWVSILEAVVAAGKATEAGKPKL
jgi:pimeloyl-ACP methyl ester carboxylesterase